MAITNKPHTHIAYTRQRIGKKFIRELEIGSGYIDDEGVAHAFLNRLPIGGFTGYVRLAPKDKLLPEATPQRPDDDEEFETGI
jgi:hypothetical protein